MKDWIITESEPMYNEYHKVTHEGIGDPCGHCVRISTIRRIGIDVWGHSEGKEETERIANMIVALPSLNEHMNQLRQALIIYRDADINSPVETSILTNDQLNFINAVLSKENEIEVENPLR